MAENLALSALFVATCAALYSVTHRLAGKPRRTLLPQTISRRLSDRFRR